uniref:J domain-containing protein n=1 Tax=Angiostrongylus cantonensis TaxID=6313 RepID=A0A0K0DDZ6_ANGCA
MKCHYEVLEVPRDADEETIKKSYRKLALKWHPDKNLDRLEECTKYFALVQSAYEVLSDPHEKAFYDRHRESILRGGFGVDVKEDSLDLFQFFTTGCYAGYEGPKGFFAVFKNVFDTLSREDYNFIEDPSVCYPTFGDATSDYETVTGPFYGFWSSFRTARSFAWLDKYNVRQANNRYELRQMEAENKKCRDVGKAERNDQIRELVAFVRKRDPRVKAYRELLEKQHEEAKRKQEINRKQQILLFSYMFAISMGCSRLHIGELLQRLADDEACSDSENDEGEELPFCVVCDKSFKTLNAMVNHENSKQHKKQLAELKRHMKEEDHALFDLSTEFSPQNEEQKGKKAKRRSKKKTTCGEDLSWEAVDLRENPEEQEAKITTLGAPINIGPKIGTCDKCKQIFESRTKLFEHLRLTGHATLKASATPQPTSRNKKDRRK